jgi:hypothetical protein
MDARCGISASADKGNIARNHPQLELNHTLSELYAARRNQLHECRLVKTSAVSRSEYERVKPEYGRKSPMVKSGPAVRRSLSCCTARTILTFSRNHCGRATPVLDLFVTGMFLPIAPTPAKKRARVETSKAEGVRQR